MQSVSSSIWTRVSIAVSISCDDNHYTTGTYIYKSGKIIDIFYKQFLAKHRIVKVKDPLYTTDHVW